MGALTAALVAALTSPALFTDTLAIGSIKAAEWTTRVAGVISCELADAAFGTEPRERALLAGTGLGIETASMLTVLGTFLQTVVSGVGGQTVDANTLGTVENSTASAVLLASVALGSGE